LTKLGTKYFIKVVFCVRVTKNMHFASSQVRRIALWFEVRLNIRAKKATTFSVHTKTLHALAIELLAFRFVLTPFLLFFFFI